MALTWNIAGIEKRLGKEEADKLTTSSFPPEYSGQGPQWHPVTQSIVWRLMAVGIASITEENYEKVYFRVRTYEHITGSAMAYERNGELRRCPITRQDIINHIGLITNVSTLTEAKWKEKVLQLAEREAQLPLSHPSAHDVCREQAEWALAEKKAG
jgi:hypothetical protein